MSISLVCLLLILPALCASSLQCCGYLFCRQERIRQLKQAQKKAKFGTMEQITRGDFVQQVTNAGEDVYVVVHLYKDK